jgi:hypothetical protein
MSIQIALQASPRRRGADQRPAIDRSVHASPPLDRPSVEQIFGDTTQAPVLSASASNLSGVNSLTWLQGQSFPVTHDNSTWLIHDTTTTTASSGGSGSGSGEHATCTGIACLFDGDL